MGGEAMGRRERKVQKESREGKEKGKGRKNGGSRKNGNEIIENPVLVKCKPGESWCLQVGNDLGIELAIEGIRKAAKMVKANDYIFSPVGMDDADGPKFVHPDDRKKNIKKDRNSRQNDPCKCGRKKGRRLSKCKENCDKNETPKRGSRSGGAPASGKPGAGKDCSEKCGQLKGRVAKQACKRRKASSQCNKGNGGKGRMGPGNRRPKVPKNHLNKRG